MCTTDAGLSIIIFVCKVGIYIAQAYNHYAYATHGLKWIKQCFTFYQKKVVTNVMESKNLKTVLIDANCMENNVDISYY